LKRDYSRTLYADLAALASGRVAGSPHEMEVTAGAWLASAGIPPERRALVRAADVRYRRQAYELTLPLAEGPIARASLDTLAAAFHEKHRQTYGHANRPPAQAHARTVSGQRTCASQNAGGVVSADRFGTLSRLLAGRLGGRRNPRGSRDHRGDGLDDRRAARLDRLGRWQGLYSAAQEVSHARHPSRSAAPPAPDRPRPLRGGQERALLGRRGDED